MSKEERRIVSYHEVGHALVSALQKHSGAGPEDHHCSKDHGCFGICYECSGRRKYLSTKKELEARLVELMGGLQQRGRSFLKLLLPVLLTISSRPPTWARAVVTSTACLKIRSYGS